MPEDEHVIQALASDRPYPPLRNGVCLWRPNWRSNLFNPKGSDSAVENSPVTAVPVVNQVPGRISITITGLYHLLSQPIGRGMSSDSDMHDLPRAVTDDEEDVQCPEPDGLNREEIASPKVLRLLSEKLAPTWRRPPVPRLAHVLSDRPSADLVTKPG